MDEWTRERFGPVPRRERYARPNPRRGDPVVATAVVLQRRRILLAASDNAAEPPELSLPEGKVAA